MSFSACLLARFKMFTLMVLFGLEFFDQMRVHLCLKDRNAYEVNLYKLKAEGSFLSQHGYGHTLKCS